MDDMTVLCVGLISMGILSSIAAFLFGRNYTELKRQYYEDKILAISRAKDCLIEKQRTVFEAARAEYERRIRELKAERDWDNGRARGEKDG